MSGAEVFNDSIIQTYEHINIQWFKIIHSISRLKSSSISMLMLVNI